MPAAPEADAIRRALDAIKSVVGPTGWLDAPDDVAPYLQEQRGLYRGETCLVVRPASTDEVSRVVAICADSGLAVTPQGGNTGLCGAGVPSESQPNIVLSLARMRSVRAVDAPNFTITMDAGCVLADIQQAAADADRLFPLSLGAEGSCQIGGNLSTNAGGIQVLRYGNMRELTLGLEVVLPDGSVLDSLRALRKDNTGYDLKQLFIGAEGTLGIITAATLRLFPRPVQTATAYAALSRIEDVIALLTMSRRLTADQLTAFEFVPRFAVDIATRHIANTRDPLPGTAPWYVLMEVSSSAGEADMHGLLENVLTQAMDAGLVTDAVMATSDAQRLGMWKVREALVEAQRFEGASIKFDVSVPVTSIPDFVHTATAACLTREPTLRVLAFGHCGDGNVHFNLAAPPGDDGSFIERSDEFATLVFDIVRSLRGSISAEHGIGRTKREAMGIYKSATELALMHRLKAAIDPLAIMNPGKVLPQAESAAGTHERKQR
ncbi:FAD-binding oxidoreductase [Variovorax sp. KK3]